MRKIARRYSRGPNAPRRADLIESLRDVTIADDERLDLGDFAVGDAEARDEDGRQST